MGGDGKGEEAITGEEAVDDGTLLLIRVDADAAEGITPSSDTLLGAGVGMLATLSFVSSLVESRWLCCVCARFLSATAVLSFMLLKEGESSLLGRRVSVLPLALGLKGGMS